MKQEPGKRIVSKGEYRRLLIRYAGVRGLGMVLLLLACLTALLTFGFLCACAASLWYFRMGGCLIAILSLFAACALGYITQGAGNAVASVMGRADYLQEVISHIDASELSDVVRLVRASSEPMQPQQAVLLRAAIQSEQTPAEQLVRPAGGQE